MTLLVKNDFLADLRNNSAEDWIVVMGNEGGDLDSMASALALAWHFDHAESKKAVALLQTAEDALHLRPENVEALRSAGMSSGHRDLLSTYELVSRPLIRHHEIDSELVVKRLMNCRSNQTKLAIEFEESRSWTITFRGRFGLHHTSLRSSIIMSIGIFRSTSHLD